MSIITLNNLIKKRDKISFILSGSKSISHRALIINYLQNASLVMKNLSNSDDTRVLKKALSLSSELIDLKESGTAMRFLLSLFAFKKNNITLIGHDYLLQRPISELIYALNKLGAYIECDSNRIIINNNIEFTTNKLDLNSNKTSQYISSLLLIAPYFPKGLELSFNPNIYSKTYIDMTVSMMKNCGAVLSISKNKINISPVKYTRCISIIESDWTSLSYLLEAFLFSSLNIIDVTSLYQNSIQGDRIVLDFFALFGVSAVFENDTLLLRKIKNFTFPKKIEWDFNNNPDLFPTFIVVCFALGVKLIASGVKNLIYKESDRIECVKKELFKFNCNLVMKSSDCVFIQSNSIQISNQVIPIDTHNDHRIALSFSPLALLGYKLKINNIEVVSKSYPNFFADLTKFGVIIK